MEDGPGRLAADAQRMAPMKAGTGVWMRKPTRNPMATTISTTATSRTRSDRLRPTSTAERAIGRDRNRSISPLCRSSARPMAVFIPPKATVWTKTPGMRKST